MKWLNLGLIRLFEFLTLLLYSFFVLVYFGAWLLLPLDILSVLIQALGGLGLPVIVSMPVAAAVSGGFCYLVYKMPELYQILLNGGIELTNAGYIQIQRLESIGEKIVGPAAPTSKAA
ncbi:hypothetical protein JCM13664_15170 [Methylothermus subterraneus]